MFESRYMNIDSDVKGEHEIDYWLTKKEEEGILQNDHYEYFYTSFFDLDKNFFRRKKNIRHRLWTT